MCVCLLLWVLNRRLRWVCSDKRTSEGLGSACSCLTILYAKFLCCFFSPSKSSLFLLLLHNQLSFIFTSLPIILFFPLSPHNSFPPSSYHLSPQVPDQAGAASSAEASSRWGTVTVETAAGSGGGRGLQDWERSPGCMGQADNSWQESWCFRESERWGLWY